jgi:predicted GH43/DUF377 family glycosyl hydrolase
MFKSFQFVFAVLLTSAMIYSISAQPPVFTAYTSGNPVVPKGGPGTWDDFAAWWTGVTVVNDTFYLTYIGTSNILTDPTSIGLATSLDGITYTKSDSNPILEEDGSGFDAYSVAGAALFFQNSTWYLYYNGRSVPPTQPGNVIGRATASNPHGPWTTTEDTLLTVGSPGEWDSEVIGPVKIIATGTGLVMYYWAGNVWPGPGTQIGLATSTDGGLSWQKYDDSTTTTAPHAESDPILSLGDTGSFDDYSIWGCDVLKNSNQWEMFYSGDDGISMSICYATSNDGIIWEKDTINNPIFTPSQDPLALYGFQKPAVLFFENRYFLYYDYGIGPNSSGIGLATYPPITSIEPLFGNHSLTFELGQNYPNPFNPITNIEFRIPNSEFITLKVYNLLGEEVATLLSASLLPGSYRYEWDASGLASGVYLYRLEADSFVQTRKLILLR